MNESTASCTGEFVTLDGETESFDSIDFDGVDLC